MLVLLAAIAAPWVDLATAQPSLPGYSFQDVVFSNNSLLGEYATPTVLQSGVVSRDGYTLAGGGFILDEFGDVQSPYSFSFVIYQRAATAGAQWELVYVEPNYTTNDPGVYGEVFAAVSDDGSWVAISYASTTGGQVLQYNNVSGHGYSYVKTLNSPISGNHPYGTGVMFAHAASNDDPPFLFVGASGFEVSDVSYCFYYAYDLVNDWYGSTPTGNVSHPSLPGSPEATWPFDLFGVQGSMDISNSNTWLILGAATDTNGTDVNVGSANVYKYSGTSYLHSKTFAVAPLGLEISLAGGGFFGSSVSIVERNASTLVAVVSSPFYNATGAYPYTAGAVFTYISTNSGSTWSSFGSSPLLAPFNATASNVGFGFGAQMCGDSSMLMVAMGNPSNSGFGGDGTTHFYFYGFHASGWTSVSTITPPEDAGSPSIFSTSALLTCKADTLLYATSGIYDLAFSAGGAFAENGFGTIQSYSELPFSCGCPAGPVSPPTSPPVSPPTSPPVHPPVSPPVTAPTSPPVHPPVSPPTSPPVSPPVTPPTSPPVSPPTSPPVSPPTSPPVSPPVTPPTSPPVSPPTSPPVTPPTSPPVIPPTSPPINPPTSPPVSPPVTPPTSPPVSPPTSPPTTPPTAPPIAGPVSPPINPPTSAPSTTPISPMPFAPGAIVGLVFGCIFGVALVVLVASGTAFSGVPNIRNAQNDGPRRPPDVIQPSGSVRQRASAVANT
jgi:hypothetical protein